MCGVLCVALCLSMVDCCLLIVALCVSFGVLQNAGCRLIVVWCVWIVACVWSVVVCCVQ